MQSFEIKIGSLTDGVGSFSFRAEGDFFRSFEGTEILDGDVAADVEAEDLGDCLRVRAALKGSVSVTCDRCLEEVSIPVETEFEEDVEVHGPVIDLSQIVYDYVCTALPLQRVHPDGACNPDTLKYLNNK